MKIGIIGTGIIASAVVIGLCKAKTGHDLFLSPRNAAKAAALANEFENVRVCTSNQQVVDKADWIFICLHKKDFGVLRELKYRPEQSVINMSAEMRLPELKEIVGETTNLAHVIPLPFIASGFGPLLIYPENKAVGALFEPVSDVYYAHKQEDVHTLQIVTGMMSAYYMLLNEVVKFSDERGIVHDTSVGFASSLFSSLCKRAAETKHCDLIELAHEMTPGGYNEQAMNELMDNGAIGAWRTALDRLLFRLENSGSGK
ncbi:MAG: NAD(P)-binding domain-containing protein [Oscillospiraceae bacterium]|nr:NAD(P)-binding domain-containing protein [Oscillospiraceae bacterium]